MTGILPWLIPLAAVGLAILMVGAVVTHLRRGEYPNTLAPMVLLGLTAFAAYSLYMALAL